MTYRVGFFVFPDFHILDLTGPLSVFDSAGYFGRAYSAEIQVLSMAGGLIRSSSGLVTDTTRWNRQPVDTFIVVGGRGSRAASACVDSVAAVRYAGTTARRIASVCTGAFVLAATGLLDGRKATTHWRHAGELQSRFPRILVDGERIFIQDDRFWSSAGITAGIDLALALIESDFGPELSRAIAGELVVYHRRSGGQSQFSALQALQPASDRVRVALEYAHAHLQTELSIECLASAAALSARQLTRRFKAETGLTPARAVERLRVEEARRLLGDGGLSVAQIARAVGFANPERMRRAFIRRLGHPPQALRRASR